MAYWQTGEKDRARHWYGQAVEWMEQEELRVETTRRIRADAEKVLGFKKGSVLR
jgi:hypothetical protein